MVSVERCRVGLVGYGSLGQYLLKALTTDAALSAAYEVAWVWNRTPEKAAGCGAPVLADLASFPAAGPVGLIIEVCHPAITAAHGVAFLEHADLFLGSPTALADGELEARLRAAAAARGRALCVPAGALWGAADLAKMGAAGTLAALTVTMKKHPLSLQLEKGSAPAAALDRALASGARGETVLYDGPVRALALAAPNNVNTMAAAALASGAALGFDGVRALLVCDPSLLSHEVVIEAEGAPGPSGDRFTCRTVRHNPAAPGAVTGSATYASFAASLRAARARHAGLFLC
jgi:predicted dinucleotide-utilizing enzyme